jgi:hypothetical protein
MADLFPHPEHPTLSPRVQRYLRAAIDRLAAEPYPSEETRPRRDRLAAFLARLPDGPHGALYVTHKDVGCPSYAWLHLRGVGWIAEARWGNDGRWHLRVRAEAEARAERERLRAERRAQHEAYLVALGRAARRLECGEALRYCPGQHGGVFWEPQWRPWNTRGLSGGRFDGRWVSALSVLQRVRVAPVPELPDEESFYGLYAEALMPLLATSVPCGPEITRTVAEY